jgi:hypothetical protein
MGLPMEWRTLILRAIVVQVVMTSRLPPRPGGPLVGRAPPDDRGHRGDHWGHIRVRVLYI